MLAVFELKPLFLVRFFRTSHSVPNAIDHKLRDHMQRHLSDAMVYRSYQCTQCLDGETGPLLITFALLCFSRNLSAHGRSATKAHQVHAWQWISTGENQKEHGCL